MILLAPHICPAPTPNDIKYGICNHVLADWYASWDAPSWIMGAEIVAAFTALGLGFWIVCLLMRAWSRRWPGRS